MANLNCVVFLLLPTFISLCSARFEGIPALIWTNIGAEFQNPLAGHTTGTEEFKRDYLENVAGKTGHTLVAFVQDKLSLEDIIDNADVYNEHSKGAKFANLKNLVETYTSVHLPSVAAPGDAVDRLTSQFRGHVHHLKSPFNLKDLKINPTSANLVICHLPPNDGKSFEVIDKIIGTVSSDLKSLGVSFTALYTGRSASEDQHDESQYLGRHLLADVDEEAGNYSFFNVTECIYVFFEEMFLVVTVKKSEKPVPAKLPRGQVGKDSVCGSTNKTGTLFMTFPDIPKDTGVTKFSAKMTFDYTPSGYWRTKMSITYEINNKNISNKPIIGNDVEVDASAIYGPRKFSYHCTDGEGFTQKANASDTVVSLRFTQLQVQYNDIMNSKFGYPNDCEGFFSITILSGLMAGVVLASILAFGICMIVNISTMDRFDDPKGKTISVNVGEG